MASREEEKSRRDGVDGTFVQIEQVRTCQKVLGKKYCTPYVKEKAEVHLGPGPAERLAKGVGEAAGAVAAALASTGVGIAAAPWVALAGALVVIGYDALKNDDGSIDLYIDNVGCSAGSARIPVHVDPSTCAVILQAM